MDGIRGMLGRLRAALTPQAVMWLLAALALLMLGGTWKGSGSGDLETRVSRTLSEMDGAGRVRVVIATRAQETEAGVLSSGGGRTGEIPCGAVAVAEGADDPLVRMQLEEALCALLGLPASAVSVVTGTGGA